MIKVMVLIAGILANQTNVCMFEDGVRPRAYESFGSFNPEHANIKTKIVRLFRKSISHADHQHEVRALPEKTCVTRKFVILVSIPTVRLIFPAISALSGEKNSHFLTGSPVIDTLAKIPFELRPHMLEVMPSNDPPIDFYVVSWACPFVLKFIVPSNSTAMSGVIEVTRDLSLQNSPRPFLSAHDLVGLKSGLRGLDSGDVSLVGGPQGENQNNSSGYSEECHDPLCKRIARANKRPDKPIPTLSYLALIGGVCTFGILVFFILRPIIEPED